MFLGVGPVRGDHIYRALFLCIAGKRFHNRRSSFLTWKFTPSVLSFISNVRGTSRCYPFSDADEQMPRSRPQNTAVLLGNNASFSCYLSHESQPRYAWKFAPAGSTTKRDSYKTVSSDFHPYITVNEDPRNYISHLFINETLIEHAGNVYLPRDSRGTVGCGALNW